MCDNEGGLRISILAFFDLDCHADQSATREDSKETNRCPSDTINQVLPGKWMKGSIEPASNFAMMGHEGLPSSTRHTKIG